MPGQDALGIGLGFPVEVYPENHVGPIQISGFPGFDEPGMLQRGDAVHLHPSPHDLVQADGVLHTRIEPPVKPLVDGGVDFGFEGGIEGMHFEILFPQPLHHGVEVPIHILAGLPLQQVPQLACRSLVVEQEFLARGEKTQRFHHHRRQVHLPFGLEGFESPFLLVQEVEQVLHHLLLTLVSLGDCALGWGLGGSGQVQTEQYRQ